jgi:hypothetical protein
MMRLHLWGVCFKSYKNLVSLQTRDSPLVANHVGKDILRLQEASSSWEACFMFQII